MKVRDTMRPGENLSWCKPVSFDNGGVICCVCQGDIINIEKNGEIIPVTEESLHDLAKSLSTSYECYSGWSDTHILLDAKGKELGCDECPWNDVCEAMDMETELVNGD